MSLGQLLGNDRGRGLGIQEAVANDLANDLVGAAVVGFGAGGFALQRERSVFSEEVEQLEVALSAIAELSGSLGRAEAFALAFEEHGQFESDLIVGGHEEGTGGSREGRLLLGIENNHK